MRIPLFAILTISAFIPLLFQAGSAEIQHDLGTITALIPDGTNIYYFEVDKDVTSTSWIPDTRIKVNDGTHTRNISEKLLTYPSELSQDKENLYFATLSDTCIGQITCDYQDVYRMSKESGEYQILTKDLKSAVHISVDGDLLYVSESSGYIWKINKKDGSKSLAVRANELVMDVAVNGGKIYWIEEKSDRNSVILTLDDTGKSKTLMENLQIPYDLTIQNGRVYWNEIRASQIGGNFAEFTAIHSFNEHRAELEFENTSPVSKSFGRPNYGPYLVFDNYLFLVNNTNDDSVIHMINMHNSTKYDVGTISNYDAKYLRTDGTSLFVIGKNDQGFVIDKHPLPIVVPEFPTAMLLVLPLAFTSVFILKRFWRN